MGTERLGPEADPRWEKLALIRQHMQAANWLMWMDVRRSGDNLNHSVDMGHDVARHAWVALGHYAATGPQPDADYSFPTSYSLLVLTKTDIRWAAQVTFGPHSAGGPHDGDHRVGTPADLPLNLRILWSLATSLNAGVFFCATRLPQSCAWFHRLVETMFDMRSSLDAEGIAWRDKLAFVRLFQV